MEKSIKGINYVIDFIKNICLVLLIFMVLIVILQVFSRSLFNHSFFWSEEVALVLMVWFSLITMGLGIRDNLHLKIEFFVRLFSKRVQKYFDLMVEILLIIFALFMTVYGTKVSILMLSSTMPATKLPTAILYSPVAVTGVLILLCYTERILMFFNSRKKGEK